MSAPSTPQRTGFWFLLLGLLLYGLGLTGFKASGNNWDDSAYKALQLFHLHFHPHPEAHAATGDHVNWQLQIARFGTALWGLAVLSLLLSLLFSDRLLKFRLRHCWRGHTIVCGHCSRARALVRDLRHEGQRVAFAGACPSPEGELPRGVPFVPHGGAWSTTLQKTGVHRAARVVALNEDDRANLEIVSAIESLCAKRPAKMPALDCHAHLQDLHLQSAVYEALPGLLESESGQVRHHLFNYHEMVARLLARKYPLPEVLVQAHPLAEHFIIAGFGSLGQSVALKLVKMGQQLVQKPASEMGKWQVCRPRVTVIDRRAEAATAAFLRAHRGFASLCNFSAIEAELDSPEFTELRFLTPADAPARTSIIFCVEDESLTVRTALQMLEVCRSADKDIDGIYLRLAHPENLGALLERDRRRSDRKTWLTFFAPDDEVFTADVLLRHELDELAARIHASWQPAAAADQRAHNQPTAAGHAWNSLGVQDKESNREAADHMWAKVRTLGYELHSNGDKNAVTDPALLEELKRQEEVLARVEHYRWMTWRVLNGWSYGAERNNKNLQHPDIREYDALEEPVKEKDRVVVRCIAQLLRERRLFASRRTDK